MTGIFCSVSRFKNGDVIVSGHINWKRGTSTTWCKGADDEYCIKLTNRFTKVDDDVVTDELFNEA